MILYKRYLEVEILFAVFENLYVFIYLWLEISSAADHCCIPDPSAIVAERLTGCNTRLCKSFSLSEEGHTRQRP
jgi:hypothetical protein